MPHYEYFCHACKNTFSKVLTLAEAQIDARLGQYERWLREAHGLPNRSPA